MFRKIFVPKFDTSPMPLTWKNVEKELQRWSSQAKT
jgi:hypothetical protein